LNAKSPRYIENLSHQPLLLLLQKKKEEEEEDDDEEKFPSHLELSTHTPQDVFVPSKDNPERKIQTHVLLDHGQEKKKKEKTLSLPQIFPVQMTTENAVRDPSP
jgi:hypothetical protein